MINNILMRVQHCKHETYFYKFTCKDRNAVYLLTMILDTVLKECLAPTPSLVIYNVMVDIIKHKTLLLWFWKFPFLVGGKLKHPALISMFPVLYLAAL